MPSKKVKLKKKLSLVKKSAKRSGGTVSISKKKAAVTSKKSSIRLRPFIAPKFPENELLDFFNISEENTPNPPEVPAVTQFAPAPLSQFRSPYVIDLKKIQYDQHVNDVRSNSTSSHFFENLREEIGTKKNELAHLGKAAFARAKQNRPQTSVTILMPKETIVQNVILEETIAKRNSLSKISMPKMALPKISMPAFSLPKLGNLNPLSGLKSPDFSSFFNNFAKSLKPNILFTRYARQTVTSFVLASFLMVSPLWAFDTYQKLQEQKEKILSTTTEAIGHLKLSAGQPELSAANDQLTQAQILFTQAQDELSDVPALVNAIISALPQGSKVKTGEALLELAEKATSLAQNIVGLMSASSDGATIFDKLSAIAPVLNKEKSEIVKIKALMEKINPADIPENYREQLKSISAVVGPVADNIDILSEEADMLLKLMGNDGPKRYLLLFQNNSELRATGGFIGSYATMTINRGVIKSFIVPPGGSYDLRAGLKANIEAPKPITILAPRWEFQDANYFADFPQSAKKILSIYQESGGTTVDGVLAINSTFLGQLLKLVGPVTIDETAQTIDSENYLKVIQEDVEFGSNKSLNIPKKIIGQIIDSLMAKISNESTTLPKLGSTIFSALEEREIQIYLSDLELQKIVSGHRWSGELAQTAGDYLNIVSTNIAGGKTNLSLSDSVSVNVEIDQQGQIINTVRLTRAHLGSPENPLTNEKNNDYLRFYVPLNSELISAYGFEPIPEDAFHAPEFALETDPDLALINSTRSVKEDSETEIFMEGGKTVFANWMQIRPGETKTVTISYRLPFKLSAGESPYSLLIQKQSGKTDQTYSVNISAPSTFDYIWAYPADLRPEGRQYKVTDLPLTKDAIIGIIFQIP